MVVLILERVPPRTAGRSESMDDRTEDRDIPRPYDSPPTG